MEVDNAMYNMCLNMLFKISLRGRGWVRVIRYALEPDAQWVEG